MNITEKLNQLNNCSDLSQLKIAEMIGVRQSTVSRLLSGHWTDVRLSIAEKIDKAYKDRFDV